MGSSCLLQGGGIAQQLINISASDLCMGEKQQILVITVTEQAVVLLPGDVYYIESSLQKNYLGSPTCAFKTPSKCNGFIALDRKQDQESDCRIR